MVLEDLTAIKDDMNAFIVGHGLQRFNAYVGDDMRSVLWDSGNDLEAWKNFVELAKASGVAFLTSSEDGLEREDYDFLLERLQNGDVVLDDDMDDARNLRPHVGKLGFIQLGFSYNGVMYLYEISTSWYDTYQQLLESSEDIGTIILDERDKDDEF
jgi:hypothetical protein